MEEIGERKGRNVNRQKEIRREEGERGGGGKKKKRERKKVRKTDGQTDIQ